MVGEIDVLIAQERRKDMLRQAEHNRLVRLALSGRARREAMYCRALAWVGRLLVAWGQRLQARYGAAAPLSLPVERSP